jgi:hypothetical protein
MRSQLLFPGALLALFWGLAYSVFLWRTRPGRWLRLQQTWVSVVVGVGGNVLILGVVLDLLSWLAVLGAFGLSGGCVVGFSLFASGYVEHVEEMAEAGRSERGR